MSVFTIPLEDAAEDGNLQATVDLDGSDYKLDYQYNSREGFWYCSLLDSAGNHLRSGIKIVSNFPLLRLMMSRTRPPGELMCMDTRIEPDDPGLEDLDVNAEFGYVDQAEIQAL